MKFLVDTNIIINLEDNKQIDKDFASFHRLCQKHSCSILIHPGSKEDIKRDKDIKRKEISLSKLRKYQEMANPADLYSGFQSMIKKDNDRVDLSLLTQLFHGYVDYLVTEDRGIQKIAVKFGLNHKVLKPKQGAELIENKYKVHVPKHPIIAHVSTRTLVDRLNETFFDSLKEDYDFVTWFKQKCAKQDRMCYLLEVDHEIVALLIYNVEKYDHKEHSFIQGGSDVLKLCTLKVDSPGRGKKIGELFLGKMFHYCLENQINNLFITTFERQEHLRKLFLDYGFTEEAFTNKEGKLENVLYRSLSKSNLSSKIINTRKCHPFFSGGGTDKYVVPVIEEWYFRLFKDSPIRAPKLFDVDTESVSDVVGNSIQKAYICKSTGKRWNRGTYCFFTCQER